LKRRTKSGADASAIEQAIAESANNDDNFELQLTAAEELLRLHPGSSRARSYQVWALRQLKRYDQYERAQRQAVTEAKSSSYRRTDALLELADLQAQTGKLAESRKTLQQVIDDGQAFDRSRAYNNAAWNGLFMEQRPKDIVEQAVQAVQLSRDDKYSAVHTLACVYLDQGKIADAQRTFDQLLQIDKLSKLRDGTRYVLGGLAEAYGMLDEARRAYESLEPPKEPSPTATYWLAQRRLKALAKVR
jgi:tetratricopeptide (TPR) repeat protein